MTKEKFETTKGDIDRQTMQLRKTKSQKDKQWSTKHLLK